MTAQPPIGTDNLKEFGAFRLAAVIRKYWTDLGYPEPKVRVEKISSVGTVKVDREGNDDKEGGGKNAYYVVRSDMVGGMPAGKRTRRAA